VAALYVTHDLAVVAAVATRVAVMYAGRIVEEIAADRLQTAARHPYTRALLGAVPDMSTSRTQALTVIPGRPPELAALPQGCAFAPRCVAASSRCWTADPPLLQVEHSQRVACWNPVPPRPTVRVEVGPMPHQSMETPVE
jgi:oligopeptide/dipeptide ABC transporter ATP-binding protein